MKLMTAEKVIEYSKKYNVAIYKRDGSIKLGTPSESNIKPSLVKILTIHQNILRDYFGVSRV